MVADTMEKNMKKSKAAGFRSLDLMLIIAMKGEGEKNMKKSKAAGFRSLDLMLIIAMKGEGKLI